MDSAWIKKINSCLGNSLLHVMDKKIIIFQDCKKIFSTFAMLKNKGPVAQLNRASDYGSEGYRFESCRDH